MKAQLKNCIICCDTESSLDEIRPNWFGTGWPEVWNIYFTFLQLRDETKINWNTWEYMCQSKDFFSVNRETVMIVKKYVLSS